MESLTCLALWISFLANPTISSQPRFLVPAPLWPHPLEMVPLARQAGRPQLKDCLVSSLFRSPQSHTGTFTGLSCILLGRHINIFLTRVPSSESLMSELISAGGWPKTTPRGQKCRYSNPRIQRETPSSKYQHIQNVVEVEVDTLRESS